MFNILKNWLVNALVILGLAYVMPMLGVDVHVADFSAALWVALVLGLVNAIIRPVILLFTLPLTIFTFGLFVFVVNALMIMLTATLLDGFRVGGFISALLFSLGLSFVNGVLKGREKRSARNNGRIFEKAELRD